MQSELQREAPVRDIALQSTCFGCGGVVNARITPGSVRGVCLACHLVTPMTMVQTPEGVRVVQWSNAAA
jgi:hypothetical protein